MCSKKTARSQKGWGGDGLKKRNSRWTKMEAGRGDGKWSDTGYILKIKG